ncbi:uncharacterized protein TRAVEDRAFT_17897 [Trametes versicolor FP-101664 SS1]|uniref:uncharacterized protein n=1 Tax=Trametes versicolor (strain FP-101664) TaxID=717944 RepID=UPI0004623720|nr:uncharacterized protein TRAVEDRAFT_17897 [Trametes versicolor FP-101664 SS1]EIW63616.1 hypothetical protein TRAVEDRAFT_17897 [Trametes versicolor FP-101664 SS1]
MSLVLPLVGGPAWPEDQQEAQVLPIHEHRSGPNTLLGSRERGVIGRKEFMGKLKSGCLGGTYRSNTCPGPPRKTEELFAPLSALRSSPRADGASWSPLSALLEATRPYGALRNASILGQLASRVAKKSVEKSKKSWLILTTSVYATILFIPAVNISLADLAQGCATFAEAVEAAAKEG